MVEYRRRVGRQVGGGQVAAERSEVLLVVVERFPNAGEGDEGVGLDGAAHEDQRRIGLQVDPPTERVAELLRARGG